MGRWEPNALERLRQAAMELFLERGYDRTTVGDIAARAALTERTFFRYFTDKREVLFAGSEEFVTLILESIASAPKMKAPLEVVVTAIGATAPFFEARRAHARKRHALITAHAELQERELIKLAKLAFAIASSLRQRGLAETTADLVAGTGLTVFKSAFERWIEDTKKQRDVAHHVRAALAELRLVTAEAGASASARPTAVHKKTGRTRKPKV